MMFMYNLWWFFTIIHGWIDRKIVQPALFVICFFSHVSWLQHLPRFDSKLPLATLYPGRESIARSAWCPIWHSIQVPGQFSNIFFKDLLGCHIWLGLCRDCPTSTRYCRLCLHWGWLRVRLRTPWGQFFKSVGEKPQEELISGWRSFQSWHGNWQAWREHWTIHIFQ